MPGDVDFQKMIRDFREEHGVEPHAHIPPGDLKICICVRKRPINDKERKRKDYDAVTCFNPVVSQVSIYINDSLHNINEMMPPPRFSPRSWSMTASFVWTASPSI